MGGVVCDASECVILSRIQDNYNTIETITILNIQLSRIQDNQSTSGSRKITKCYQFLLFPTDSA